MKYEPTIGLEIHTELKTRTKMFCGCLNDPDEKHPNINICPICTGHPGTLPVINKRAVEAVLKLGLALNSKIPEISKFDRKNYFYPDLPKGYQISQYDKPLVLGGYLDVSNPSRMTSNESRINESKKFENNLSLLEENSRTTRIQRIHLEEDTGKLIHSADGKSSLVDFNRAGLPLMELVTEPDIKSGEEAVKFAKELQLILRYLEISDADMEKGQMRVEANISLMATNMDTNSTNDIREIGDYIREDSRELGTKVEIKNLNSFRAVEGAINYEIKRQSEILEKGEKVKQETRGWDDAAKKTVSQRFKEESHDYRYFPEPDLPPMDLTKFNLEELKISIPELPAQKRVRFTEEYGLSVEQTEVLVSDRRLAAFLEESASELKSVIPATSYQLLFNYLTSDLLGLMNQEGIGIAELKITPEHLAHLVALVEKGELSSRMAKDILAEMFKTGLDPHEIIKKKGIAQVSDEEIIRKAVEEIIAENPVAVADYKKGKSNALQFLIGKTMAKLKGQGNPSIIRQILTKIIE